VPELRIERVERHRITALRDRVLSDATHTVRTVSGDRATTTRHWAALLGETVVGCASVMQLRGHALRAMAVAPEHQGAGVGAALLRVVVAEVDRPMWCNARLAAVPFYARMGWVAVGPVFVLQDRGPHQRMTWDV
jgi:GNAT superfamily N-acetyltransferase